MKKVKIKHWKIISAFLVAYDLVAVVLSYFLALWLRFDCRWSRIEEQYLVVYWPYILVYAVVCCAVFFLFKMYRCVWRFVSVNELVRFTSASLLSSILYTVVISLIFGRMPVSYYALGALIQLGAVVAVRFSYRFVLFFLSHVNISFRSKQPKKVMVIGAGNAGEMIIKDILKSKEINEKVKCIIDDNPNKWNREVDGVKVVGGREKIVDSVRKYKIDKIYIAVPSAPRAELKKIFEICSQTVCEVKNLPGFYQLASGDVTVKEMKDVSVEDLLGRDPVKVDLSEIHKYISGKTILVTGGGGSIGSELCRQIALNNPKKLIILEIYENNAYDIQFELKNKYPGLDLEVLIGSVRDSRRLKQIFETYTPQIVYHAAAHKHVPLMEDSPNESIKNNVVGTYKTAYAALMYGCERFVLISTDKAVNPTNIMGASKRLCEMVIQAFDAKVKAKKTDDIPNLFTHDESMDTLSYPGIPENARTEFVAVRFGNVLGSNGSVIPLFRKQIEQGGPVTVTDPEIIRYFMTIPEAVSLVMAAGTYAKGGEIFVLDMGSPVKIDTLARNLIKLSGFKPDKDIKIVYTGLRPGEKLYEERLMAEEGLSKTPSDLIFIGKPVPFDVDEFNSKLKELMDKSYNNDESIRQTVAEMVSTYKPVGEYS